MTGIKEALYYIFLLVVIGACAFSLAAFFGKWNSLLDLMSHFRIPYLWVHLVGLIGLFLLKRFKIAGLVLLCLLINLSQILPFYATAPGMPTKYPSIRLRLLQFNTWASNRKPNLIVKLIQDTQADLIALEELSTENYDYLLQHGAFNEYPYSSRLISDRLLLLSHYPLIGQPEFASYPPMIKTKVEIAKQPVSLIVVHTWRPIGGYPQYLRQMERLSQAVQSLPQPTVILGDLNTGPWSYPFRKLLTRTGLQNTQNGQGVALTYPCIIPKTQIPFLFPLLPIDHVLVGGQIQVGKRWNASFSGSDHLPVIVDVKINIIKPKKNSP